MNDRDALLRAICTDPDDDTPRLVFADWLQEHGDEDRAEFVRAQVRHAALLRNAAPDANNLAGRARGHWERHKREWLAELPRVAGVTWHDAFFRGMVECATVSSDAVLVRNAATVFGQPLRHLVIDYFEGETGFSALRGLSGLKTLKLGGRRSTERAGSELLRCDGFSESVLVFCYFLCSDRELSRQLKAKFGARVETMVVEPSRR
jgi:uncharacterized protein (TIGR02996 family)